MIKLLIICNIISCAFSEFNGPFLIWGRKELNNKNVPALEMIDDDFLRILYSESTSIVMFQKNTSTALNEENFPLFKELLNGKINNNNQWMYLPQIRLQSDPIDFNANVEIINLVGPVSQQDIELSALYKDAVNTYGNGNVLGILANKVDHGIYKRAAGEEVIPLPSTTPSSAPSPADGDKTEDTFVYRNEMAKTILSTSSAPIIMDKNVKTVLKSIYVTHSGGKGQLSMLVVIFKGERNGESVKIILRFRFTISNGYWSLNDVEVEEDNMLNLLTAVNPASAPLHFSYTCHKPLVFKNGTMTLTLENVQTQPKIERTPLRFNDPIDCVGFTTAPIWSGIFVTSILLFVLTIGIICIMDIKPPNRFESNRSKQLQFAVQE